MERDVWRNIGSTAERRKPEQPRISDFSQWANLFPMIRPDRKPGSEDRAPLSVQRLSVARDTPVDVSPIKDSIRPRNAGGQATEPGGQDRTEPSYDLPRSPGTSSHGDKRKPSSGELRRPKGSRPLTERRIRNISEHYVASRECCAQMLRDVLERRHKRASLKRSQASHEAPEDQDAQVSLWIEAEIARLVGLGLINDARYAEMKARAALSAGKGLRAIMLDLTRRGVDAQIVEAAVTEASRELTGAWASDPDSEDVAALREDAEAQSIDACMRKKRIGPYRGAALPQDWKEARKIWAREAAALARRGFSVDLIRSALERAPDEDG